MRRRPMREMSGRHGYAPERRADWVPAPLAQQRLQGYRVARAAGAGPAALEGTPSMLGSVAVQEKLHAPMLAHRLGAGARPGRKA